VLRSKSNVPDVYALGSLPTKWCDQKKSFETIKLTEGMGRNDKKDYTVVFRLAPVTSTERVDP
tara:strand:- start:919 stop:1107 length:189 start_codon:yes stop_codon:yes gene_type:complete